MLASRAFPHFEQIKGFVRPAVQYAREISVHSERFWQWGRGPMAVFLPAHGPEGAALLRIYRIAYALRPLGWRTLVLPHRLTLAQRQRFLSRIAPDVVVMQGARHALNRPALYPNQRVVFDMDDADFHLPHLVEPVRAAMQDVSGVVAGSRYIADWCIAAGAPAAEVVWTGTPVTQERRPQQQSRPAVIAWAQTRPMTYVREAAMVREITQVLAARRPGFTLRLYDRQPGDDPGFAESFNCPGLTVEWREKAQYSEYLCSFDDVAVGLAPLAWETPFSRGKSFGKVLAYLDRSVPVVSSAGGEFTQFFDQRNGTLATNIPDWVAVLERLLDQPELRQAMADRAHAAFVDRLSLTAVALQTDAILRRHARV